jgi:Ca2+-binding RTX toxin-like protein
VAWRHARGRLEVDLAAGTATVHFEDGSPGRTHSLESIEGVQGGDAQVDVLLGDDGPNLLIGGLSRTDLVEDEDRIEGRGFGDDGDDELDGGEGEDVVDGGLGIDRCRNGETTNGCELS